MGDSAGTNPITVFAILRCGRTTEAGMGAVHDVEIVAEDMMHLD